MKVFISYHRADTKYRKKLETILKAHQIEYYAVPENADFNGKSNETIRDFTCRHVKKCQVLLCLIGKETYSRPHVDREIHTALRGIVGQRLGIIAVHLPSRSDSLSQLELSTISPKLWDNKNYVVWAYWSEMDQAIESLVWTAFERANDRSLCTAHTNACMPLKHKIYYDN